MASEEPFEALLTENIERGQAINRLEADNANLRMNLERVQGHLRYSLEENERLRELLGAGVEVEGDGRLKNFSKVLTLLAERDLRIMAGERLGACTDDLAAKSERETEKFERWFLGAAQERDKAQEFIEAAEESRAGHAGRLYRLLDEMKGE